LSLFFIVSRLGSESMIVARTLLENCVDVNAVTMATRQMLTQQLRQLEADGIVRRTVHPVVPPLVDSR
jgi:DNA-binding HxlR family transcriptional regulator